MWHYGLLCYFPDPHTHSSAVYRMWSASQIIACGPPSACFFSLAYCSLGKMVSWSLEKSKKHERAYPSGTKWLCPGRSMPSAADRALCHPLQCTFPLILTGMHSLDLLLFILCLTPTLQPRCLFLSSSWIVGFSLSLCLRQPADLACRQCQWCYMHGFQLSGVVRLEGIKHIPVTEYTCWLYNFLDTLHLSYKENKIQWNV